MAKELVSHDELKDWDRKEIIERAKNFAKQYCVGDGKSFKLKDYPTDDYPKLKKKDKKVAKELLHLGVETLAAMQDMMYAQDKWSLLLIFQAMDAAGKDGAIKHVMSGLNPQGCQVNSFKAPSAEDLDHDFLWRCTKRLPERGRIGIFNRSYYEEVLVVRVHEKILQSQKVPKELITETFQFDKQRLFVTQGFIGSTTTNLTTTLGREGSDFTAAILGNVLNAESVTIWKDVPGVLSADPKKMEGTVKIDNLSYREAVEMTHSGAQVIHPKTMKPLHNKNIPLYVKSFVSPHDSGTVIHNIDHKIQLPPIFIMKENQLLVTLSPKDFSFISIEDIDRVVNFLMNNRVKITLMQQSAIDLNLVLDAPEANWEEIFSELSPYYSVRYNTNLTLITIRHYTEEVLDWMVKEKDIYLEQHSRLTARMLVKQ